MTSFLNSTAVNTTIHENSVRARRWLNLRGKSGFEDRSRGSDRLLIVLAGYKSYLWSLTIERIRRFVPAEIDVCVVSPGVCLPELAALAEANGWSYLHSSANKVSLAQNLAIQAHPSARYIYKIDEDVFIAEGFFEGLITGYRAIEDEGIYRPGFCAPVMNVHGFTYALFLEQRGLTAEYLERFGELRRAAIDLAARDSGEAAVWLWERSVPLDSVATEFAALPFRYSTVPHRFSIAALLFERDLWEWMGGFRVSLRSSVLGEDEKYLCMTCTERSRVICVAHNVFAGHLGFGPQEAALKAALPGLRPGLELAPPSLSARTSPA